METVLKLALLSTIAAVLSSCATPYQSPQAGPTATFGLYGKNHVFEFTNLSIFDDPIECRGAHPLPFDGHPIPIAANKPVTIFITHEAAGYERAGQVVTFFPKENQHYFLVTEPEASQRSYETLYAVARKVELKNNEVSYQSVPFFIREYDQGIWSGKFTCTDPLMKARLRKQAL